MTIKHYVLLAAAFSRSLPDKENVREQWKRDVEAVADALGRDNGAFDRQRFLVAAEGNEL